MIDLMLPLPGLSSVSGKTVVAKFDGGLLSSGGGILVLREIEQRLRVADRLAACIRDPRSPDQITHSLADIIGFRLLMIAAGYEDGNVSTFTLGTFRPPCGHPVPRIEISARSAAPRRQCVKISKDDKVS